MKIKHNSVCICCGKELYSPVKYDLCGKCGYEMRKAKEMENIKRELIKYELKATRED